MTVYAENACFGVVHQMIFHVPHMAVPTPYMYFEDEQSMPRRELNIIRPSYKLPLLVVAEFNFEAIPLESRIAVATPYRQFDALNILLRVKHFRAPKQKPESFSGFWELHTLDCFGGPLSS